MYILELQVCRANLFLRGTSAILAQECASLHILGLRVFLTKNSLLVITPDILVRFAPPARLQIDGTDARSLAEIKRRRIFDTLSIYFGVATTQMCRIFAKVN